jgi:hypothetical protein
MMQDLPPVEIGEMVISTNIQHEDKLHMTMTVKFPYMETTQVITMDQLRKLRQYIEATLVDADLAAYVLRIKKEREDLNATRDA